MRIVSSQIFPDRLPRHFQLGHVLQFCIPLTELIKQLRFSTRYNPISSLTGIVRVFITGGLKSFSVKSGQCILPNLVVLCQTVRALIRSAWTFDPLRPAFQGHSRSSTEIDPPHRTSYNRVPYSNIWASRIVSEINGNFDRISPTFPPPCNQRPRRRGSPWSWVPAPKVKKLE